VNEAFPLGHKLREPLSISCSQTTEETPVVIIGAGMAGLNAAWWLEKHGFRDFVVLEMERDAGGQFTLGRE